ncbi:MAG: DUF6763 family protein [Pseudomonadota bacterium]
MTDITPVIGDWYKRLGGYLFEVVAVDESERTIEVQHFDGTVGEFDLDSWRDLLIESAQPPEDWSGSLDIVKEDYGVDFEAAPGEHWDDPLSFFDKTE